MTIFPSFKGFHPLFFPSPSPAFADARLARFPNDASDHLAKRSFPPNRGESCRIGADGVGGLARFNFRSRQNLAKTKAQTRAHVEPIAIKTNMNIGRWFDVAFVAFEEVGSEETGAYVV